MHLGEYNSYFEEVVNANMERWIQLALTTITLIFAVGVWKGHRDYSADNIEKKFQELKDDLKVARDRHHHNVEMIQAAIGQLVSTKECDRVTRMEDEEHNRLWKELDVLRSRIFQLEKTKQ